MSKNFNNFLKFKWVPYGIYKGYVPRKITKFKYIICEPLYNLYSARIRGFTKERNCVRHINRITCV